MMTLQALPVALHGPALPPHFIISTLHSAVLRTRWQSPSPSTNTHMILVMTLDMLHWDSPHNHLINCWKGTERKINYEMEKNCLFEMLRRLGPRVTSNGLKRTGWFAIYGLILKTELQIVIF